jgi:hypothetical protein
MEEGGYGEDMKGGGLEVGGYGWDMKGGGD